VCVREERWSDNTLFGKGARRVCVCVRERWSGNILFCKGEKRFLSRVAEMRLFVCRCANPSNITDPHRLHTLTCGEDASMRQAVPVTPTFPTTTSKIIRIAVMQGAVSYLMEEDLWPRRIA
jgi:hypothetical protein